MRGRPIQGARERYRRGAGSGGVEGKRGLRGVTGLKAQKARLEHEWFLAEQPGQS